MSLYLAASLLLLSVTRASTSSSKQCYGPDYSETFPFYGISSDICIHAYYNSSTTKSLKITLSYGDTIYGTESFSDRDPSFDEKEICDPDFPSPFKGLDACSICLGFDDVFLSDNWARICPQYIFKCLTPIGGSVKKEYPMPCFSVGNDDADDIAEIVGGNTDFTFKLLSSNALTKDIVTDLFVAPFSISNALIMTMMAANGDTLKQILNAFELDQDSYDIFNSYSTLIQSLQHKTNNLIDIIDNNLWINSVWYQLISPQFLHDFDRFGDIINCNFRNDSYIETMKIDTKIEEITHNLIQHPLSNKNLSSSTVMLFTNTMYFKGNWKYPFIANISETFTDSNSEKIKIEMMITDNIQGIKKYNDSDVEVIELPFDDEFSDISFIMIRATKQKYLSDGPISTIQFEKSLNRTLLKKWLNGLTEINYSEKIILPYLEMYNMEEITDSLKKIGINDLFDPSKADLTNLTIPHYKVYETNFNRQDYMKITPKGIEMASFVTDGNNDKDDTNQGPIKHADKPFLFLIIDRSVNLILFAGRITNPKGWIIYDPNNNKNDHEKHTKIVIMILSLLAVFICSYCIIKYAYNRTVMQLTGIEAIPHIKQCRVCKQFCNEKIQTIYQTNPEQISPPQRYAELIHDENMNL